MIFIDAGYLRTYAREYCKSDAINYAKLGDLLARQAVSGERLEPRLIRIFYYDSMPDEKDADLVETEYKTEVLEKIRQKKKEQEEYIKRIQDTDKLDIKLGHMIISKKERTRQKGVDTLISIDMITKAFQSQYAYAVLLAGDADFVPIVEAVKHVGPIVVGAFFKEETNSEKLIHSVDRRYAMDKSTMPNNEILPKII